MDVFKDYLATIEHKDNRFKMEEIFLWIQKRFPSLVPKIAWNQPMYTDHGTYIIGFSVSKKHMSIAPEKMVVDLFSKEITLAGYEHSKMLIKIPWNRSISKELLGEIIEYNITSKKNCNSFWR